jgi:hypothetical protein
MAKLIIACAILETRLEMLVVALISSSIRIFSFVLGIRVDYNALNALYGSIDIETHKKNHTLLSVEPYNASQCI